MKIFLSQKAMSLSERTPQGALHSIGTRTIDGGEFLYNILFQFKNTRIVSGCKSGYVGKYANPNPLGIPKITILSQKAVNQF